MPIAQLIGKPFPPSHVTQAQRSQRYFGCVTWHEAEAPWNRGAARASLAYEHSGAPHICALTAQGLPQVIVDARKNHCWEKERQGKGQPRPTPGPPHSFPLPEPPQPEGREVVCRGNRESEAVVLWACSVVVAMQRWARHVGLWHECRQRYREHAVVGSPSVHMPPGCQLSAPVTCRPRSSASRMPAATHELLTRVF